MYKADNNVSGFSLGSGIFSPFFTLNFASNNCIIKINITTIPRISGMEAGDIFKLNEFLKSVAKYFIPIVALSIESFGKLNPRNGQNKVRGSPHI